ncbi:MAG: histidinol phosphatase-like enzyme [Planctomycetota bacterium]|jgi:histidinol phosphatase-like enzyme
MFRAARANWHLYVIGNEDDVAFGRLTLAEYERTREHFGRHLESFGIQVDRDYSCVDNPEGVAGRCNDSVYLLPNTGAFFHAAHTDGISLKHSWVVGDDTSSLVAGWRAGLRTAAVGTGAGMQDNVYDVQPHLEAEDFATLIHEFLGAQAAALR